MKLSEEIHSVNVTVLNQLLVDKWADRVAELEAELAAHCIALGRAIRGDHRGGISDYMLENALQQARDQIAREETAKCFGQ